MKDIFEYQDNFGKYQKVKSYLLYGDISSCPDPKMSVVMPVYGNPPFFMGSFLSVMNQVIDLNYEIVVVDNTPYDGSKSDILKYLEDNRPHNVFYYRNEENIGMTGNWNRGISLCRAPIYTFCHDDDMLYPDCLSTLWALHIRYPNKLIIPVCKIINESFRYPFDVKRKRIKGKDCISFDNIDIFMGNPTNGVGCLFYKDHIKKLGGYNEEYYPSMDNALHIKYIFEYGAIKYRQQLYCYRITDKNASNSVYKDFISNGLFYCQCMIPKLGLPNFFAKKLIHAYYVNITSTMEKVWAKKTETSVIPSLSDKLIGALMFIRTEMKTVRLF